MMESYEQAYLADETELRLLLSCIDQRPVLLFPPQRELSEVSGGEWQRILFSLARAGWVDCRDGMLRLEPERARLLQAMKDAERVLTVLLKDSLAGNLFFGPEETVLAELYAPGQYRIRAVEKDFLEQLLPPHPLEEGDEAMLARVLPELSEDLSRAAEAVLPWDVPPSRYFEAEPEVRVVLELFGEYGAAALGRWIWTVLPLCTVLARQDGSGCSAGLDTVQARKRLYHMCGEEANV